MAGPECLTLGTLASENHTSDNQIIIVSDNACVKYRCELAFISVSDSKVQITTLMLGRGPCLIYWARLVYLELLDVRGGGRLGAEFEPRLMAGAASRT